MKSLSLAEVARHGQKDDLYMIYKDKVYNVTPFVEEHPGGEEVILDFAGKDGTEAFDEVGHSPEAKEQLRELLIGSLDQVSATAAAAARSTTKKVKNGPSNSSTLYIIIASILAAALAAYYYFLVQR